jgi:hypothetical protein
MDINDYQFQRIIERHRACSGNESIDALERSNRSTLAVHQLLLCNHSKSLANFERGAHQTGPTGAIIPSNVHTVVVSNMFSRLRSSYPLTSSYKESLGHFVCGPVEALAYRCLDALAGSKKNATYQQIAVLGTVVTTLGFKPLKNPFQPSLFLMIVAACHNPLTVLSSWSEDDPRVCSRVLMTSSGVVNPAASPPATPPAKMCV